MPQLGAAEKGAVLSVVKENNLTAIETNAGAGSETAKAAGMAKEFRRASQQVDDESRNQVIDVRKRKKLARVFSRPDAQGVVPGDHKAEVRRRIGLKPGDIPPAGSEQEHALAATEQVQRLADGEISANKGSLEMKHVRDHLIIPGLTGMPAFDALDPVLQKAVAEGVMQDPLFQDKLQQALETGVLNPSTVEDAVAKAKAAEVEKQQAVDAATTERDAAKQSKDDAQAIVDKYTDNSASGGAKGADHDAYVQGLQEQPAKRQEITNKRLGLVNTIAGKIVSEQKALGNTKVRVTDPTIIQQAEQQVTALQQRIEDTLRAKQKIAQMQAQAGATVSVVLDPTEFASDPLLQKMAETMKLQQEVATTDAQTVEFTTAQQKLQEATVAETAAQTKLTDATTELTAAKAGVTAAEATAADVEKIAKDLGTQVEATVQKTAAEFLSEQAQKAIEESDRVQQQIDADLLKNAKNEQQKKVHGIKRRWVNRSIDKKGKEVTDRNKPQIEADLRGLEQAAKDDYDAGGADPSDPHPSQEHRNSWLKKMYADQARTAETDDTKKDDAAAQAEVEFDKMAKDDPAALEQAAANLVSSLISEAVNTGVRIDKQSMAMMSRLDWGKNTQDWIRNAGMSKLQQSAVVGPAVRDIVSNVNNDALWDSLSKNKALKYSFVGLIGAYLIMQGARKASGF